jgi:2-oxoglutarate dehydrogenase E2 component (dihydrolipoamide succinyltransferase)
MAIEVKVPALPESVADAVIADWHKQVGEAVTEDDNLVDLETDKVILEVPAISSGVISEILYSVGDTVTADQVIAVIDENAVASESPAVEQDQASAEPEPREASPALPLATADEKETVFEVPVSPSARKLMAENNLDDTMVQGSGKGGRILKEDVQNYLKQKSAKPEVTPHTTSSKAPAPASTSSPQVMQAGSRIEKRVPMTRLRARIAERLLDAQHNAAILTTFNEVNMKPIMDLRARYKDKFEQEHGVKLGFMSFFIKASIEALKKFPAINASIDDGDIVYHGYFDIGVAVSGPSGLVVPVLRNAEDMSVAQTEQAIIDFAIKAKNNSLAIEDITGGTFTISNGGVFGSMLSTPILNPPQSAILGMHTIKERPMVVNGEITVLPMMYLALSYDHRIIDGREAVQFLVTIKDMLEEPSRMLLGV